MKRKIPVLIVTMGAAIALCLVTYAATNQSASWNKIGEGYYSDVSAAGETVVLQRVLTDKDYAEIQQQLIDTNRTPDVISAERAKDDPDIVLPDNMLPDGRFLKENWEELEQQLIKDYQGRLVCDQDGVYRAVTRQGGETTSVVLDKKEGLTISAERINVGDETVLIPKTEKGSMLASATMPDGKNAIAYSNQKMWLITGETNRAEVIVPNTYQGISYNALVEESYQKYGENSVLWCGQVTPAPDSQKIAYASNKNNLDDGYSVFLYDINTESEKLIRPGDGFFYLIVGWVDTENILCYKIKDDARTFVVIGTDGSETALNFSISDVQMIAVKNGLIAYTNPDNDMVYVGRYQKTGNLMPVYEGAVGGSLRLRSGVNEFNADGTKLALVYVPENGPYQRAAKIFDLEKNEQEKISLPQSTKGSGSNVLEVSWTNAGDLLVVAEAATDTDALAYNTWQYNGTETT